MNYLMTPLIILFTNIVNLIVIYEFQKMDYYVRKFYAEKRLENVVKKGEEGGENEGMMG